MRLKAFNMVEITIVFCLLFTTVILCIPTIFNNSKEAKIISDWKRNFAETQSNFEVFNVSDKDKLEAICRSNVENKEEEIFKIISPYINVDLNKNTKNLKTYHYKFKNGAQVPMQSLAFTRLFAYQENGDIVGFKWIDCNCSATKPCATVLFDMNGIEKPNRIGKDIFGIYLYRNQIEAFGSKLSNRELERDCNSHSSGMNCSEYFLRGGKF